jgi:hypothetical protein
MTTGEKYERAIRLIAKEESESIKKGHAPYYHPETLTRVAGCTWRLPSGRLAQTDWAWQVRTNNDDYGNDGWERVGRNLNEVIARFKS